MSAQIQDLRFSRAVPGLDIFYAAESSADRWLRDDSVLALIRFSTRTEVSAEDPRHISIGLPPLGPQRYVEVWRTRLPVIRGYDGDLHYAMDGEILFDLDEQFCVGEVDAIAGCRAEHLGVSPPGNA